MSNYYFISDTHFGHKNILTFTKDEGTLIRPGFNDIKEMNEYIISQWNSIIKSNDKVIHCGDVAFGKTNFHDCVSQLNGIKYLVLGNHDNFHISEYFKYFKKIYSSLYLGKDDAIVTHIPVHETSLRRFKVNIHGHMHHNKLNDDRYFNVSCEQLDYKPIHFDEIMNSLIK